jgi:hypothetical protein
MELPPEASHSIPPYIEAAYRWLLENVHAPYPSSTTKRELARSSRTSLYAIDRWFTKIRQKMGWSAICKDYFSNDRQATIDAAYLAFFQDDPANPLRLDISLRFSQMRNDAAQLYQHKFYQSKLSGKLGSMVQDVTTEDVAAMDKRRASLMSEEKQKKAEARKARRIQRQRERQIAKRKAVESYPSPDRSLHGSPAQSHASLPSFGEDSDDFEDENTPPPTPFVSSKRRRLSSSDPCDANRHAMDNHVYVHSKRHPYVVCSRICLLILTTTAVQTIHLQQWSRSTSL